MIELRIPQLVPEGSAPNGREHWAVKHRRAKKERAAVQAALLARGPKARPEPPLVVTMVRCAPHLKRDDDNWNATMKYVRDEIARWLGIDDGDPRVTWRVEQQKAARAQQGTLVRIEAIDDDDEPAEAQA